MFEFQLMNEYEFSWSFNNNDDQFDMSLVLNLMVLKQKYSGSFSVLI